MALPIIKKGDIFELNTNVGLAYLQCVEESSKTECEMMRILNGTYSDILEANIENLIYQKELYFLEFPLKYAVKKKCVKKIGNYSVPSDLAVPRYYRTEHIIRGEFLGWHIVDRITLKRQLVKELSAEQIKLSPYGMWNDTLIAERISEGWTLDKWR